MDQTLQTLIDQRPFMREPIVVTGTEVRYQPSNYEGVCEQEPTELPVQHSGSNAVARRLFSQDWKDVQDRVRDALTSRFMADTHCSS